MNKTFIVILALFIGLFCYFLAPILTPFLAGAILAYLANPLVTKLTNWHMPRILSVIIVFLILFLIIALMVFLLIPLVEKQFVVLLDYLPDVIDWLQATVVPWLNNHFGVQDVINVQMVKTTLAENWTKAGGVASWFLKTALHSGFALIAWFTNFVLIPVVTFYLLRDWEKLLVGIKKLLPRRYETTIVELALECDNVLSAFFRGQLLVMLSLGVIYSLGLTMMGLRVGIIIGLIAGLASIVPYLGFIVGIISASIAAYIQFGTFGHVLLVWLVFGIGQSIEGTLLTPNLVGGRIGLHPVAVIFAVLTGASLFGFFGVLLALPVAAIVMVLLRFAFQHYAASRLYQ